MKLVSSLLAACLVIVLALLAFTRPVPPDKPNILFILADDWSYPYASVYGDTLLRTPNLDKLARHGTLFNNAFCSSPSCTPSRASLLTGRYPHKLGEGVNLCGKLDVGIPTYVRLLEQAGYAVAFDRKGWAPGDFRKMGYRVNPAGKQADFNRFIDKLSSRQPFFFWFGTHDPHRSFEAGSGRKAGINPDRLTVPAFLPDVPEIREDLADYRAEIERLDREIGDLITKLDKAGKLEHTIIVVTSDNGMPFPHAKANLYDSGTRVPLLISSFSGQVKTGVRHDSFVNLIDLTPTFLDWAGVTTRPDMDGQSLLPVLSGEKAVHRNEVFLERERHCLCRADFNFGAGYPMRAIRTKDYLYVRNFRPERMPAGDETIPGTPSVYGDVDGGPTKAYLMDHRNEPAVRPVFRMGFDKRPAEELYVLRDDPDNVRNRADDPAYAAVKKNLSQRLSQWMQTENDPRRNGGGDQIDRYVSTSRAWITKWDIVLLDE